MHFKCSHSATSTRHCTAHFASPRWERTRYLRQQSVLILPCPLHCSKDPTYLASALPPHLDRYRYIFIPVNDSQPQAGYSGSHWSLLVFCRPNLTFYYYDTLHGTNQHVARLTAGRMVPLLRLTRQTIFKPVPTPQQDNGADCGGKNERGLRCKDTRAEIGWYNSLCDRHHG